jgi:hypothetical protein
MPQGALHEVLDGAREPDLNGLGSRRRWARRARTSLGCSRPAQDLPRQTARDPRSEPRPTRALHSPRP